jgi:hypothetical protein
VLVAVLASGCVFYPKTVEYYDAACEIRARQMVLKSEAMERPCDWTRSQDDARACFAMHLGYSVASAIVSGSIVVAGNTIYWLEKHGKCISKS